VISQNSYQILLEQHRLQIKESLDRTPERRFKLGKEAQAVNRDGGIECINQTVVKSKVWQGALMDQHQEWLQEAMVVE